MTTSDVKILVVEDEAIVAKDIARSLERLGYSISGTVSSGEETLQISTNEKPDLVLMDIHLEGKMDGIQTAEIVRRRLHIPVIYLTAFTDKATLERAKLSEPFGYIVKPFADKDLHVAVEMALYKHKAEREIERHTRAIEALYSFTRVLNASDNLEALLDKSAGFLVDNPGVLAGCIYLKSDDEEVFQLERSFGSDCDAFAIDSVSISTCPILGSVVDSYEAKIAENLSETGLVAEGYSFSQSPKGLVSVLRSGELILGFLAMIFREYDKYTVSFMETAGLELGSAIRRKAAEDGLRGSEKRYRNIFELSPEAIILVGKSGKVLAVNPRLHQWLGYDSEEVVGKYIYELELLTEQSKGLIKNNFMRRMQGKNIPPYEVVFTSKAGSREVGFIHASLVRDERGESAADLILVSNITERKQAEEEVKRKLAYETSHALCSQFLLELRDVDNALTKVLEELLSVVQASRVEIYREFEDPEEGLGLGLVYESFAPGLEPHIDHPLLKAMAYKDLGEHFHENLLVGDFYGGLAQDLPDSLMVLAEFLDVKSLLIVPLRVDGNLWGILLVSDCLQERIWNRDDFNFVQTIASMTSSTLERKRADEALRQSEEKYRTLVDNANEAIVVAQDGLLKFINPQTLNLTGYTREELTDKPFAELIHPYDRGTVVEHYTKGLQGEDILYAYSFRIVDKSGDTKWVELRAVLIEWSGRLAALNFIVDITERRKAEDELKKAYKAREELEQIINQSEAIIFLWRNEENWPVDFVSDNIRLYGYAPQDWYSGKVMYADLVHPDDLERVAAQVIRYSEEGRTEFSQEYRVVTKRGNVRWVDDRTLVRRDSLGNITHYQGIILDITERKKAEEELRDSKERLKATLDALPDIMFEVDREGIIWDFRTPREDLLYLPAEKFLGRKVADVIPQDAAGIIMQALAEAAEKGRHTGAVYSLEMPGGTNWFELSIAAKGDPESPEGRLIVTARDVTPRKLAEETIRRERDKAQKYLDVAGVMLLVVGSDQEVKMINKKGCEILGYREDEIINKNWFDCFLPKHARKEAMKLFDRLIAGKIGFAEYLESSIQNRQGEERIIAWHNADLVDEEGNVIGILSSGEDITERKQAEEKEREYLQNMMFLSESAMDLVELAPSVDVYSFLAKRLKTLVNDGFVMVSSFDVKSQRFVLKELIGDSKAISASFRLIGRSVLGASFPITDEAREGLTAGKLVEVQGGLYQLSGEGIPKQLCHSIEHLLGLGKIYAMGFSRQSELFGSAIILLRQGMELNDKNVLETFISQASVALQRKHAESALAESEKQYRTLVETLQEGLGVVDPEEVIVFANPSFCGMLGYSREELVGKNVREIIPRREQDKLLEQTAKRQEGLTSHYELQMICKDGESKEVRISAVPLMDERGGYQGSVGLILDITDQKRAEEALRESEERYRVFTEEALVGVYIYGNGRYLFVNQAMADITGYSRNELLSLGPSELGLPGDRNSLDRNSKNSGRTSLEYTLDICRRNGEKAILEVRVRSIPYGKGVAYLGNCIDITDRVQQKEQLEQAKKEWEYTFDAISDMVMMVGLKGQLLKVNRAVKMYTGQVSSDLLGRDYVDVFNLTDGNGLREFYLNALKSVTPASYEIKDSAKEKDFWVSASPLLDAGGGHIATVCVARDVTQMRRIERALVDSELQFRGLAESAKDIIFNIDEDGSILYLNPAMKDIMGYDPAQFIGVNVRDLADSQLFGVSTKEILKGYLVQVHDEKSLPLFEVEARDAKGKKHVLEFSTQQVSNQMIGIARDVTERKKMQDQLTRASKLASVGVLAAGLAHQINNPLASILATTSALKEMLANEPDVPQILKDKTAKYVGKMEEQLDRTHRIVSSLLEFTQEKRMDVRPNDANEIIQGALQFIAQHLSFRDIDLEFVLNGKVPFAIVDKGAFREAIVNVIQNAYEAMNGKGRIVISTETENERSLCIRISNNGPPIPSDIREEIFELLFSTKTERKGTGLGLPVAAMLLEHFGGRIYLEESADSLTTFVIEVPTHSKEEE